jgi:hypothetical protein
VKPRHYVKARPGAESVEQLPDRAELSALYPTPHTANTNPISAMTERDLQRAKDLDKYVRSLRLLTPKLAALICLPYVGGVFISEQLSRQVSSIGMGDIGGAMFVVFSGFAVSLGLLAASYFTFKQAHGYIRDRLLKTWPFILTAFIAMIGITPLAYDIAGQVSGFWLGELVKLSSIFGAGAIVTTVNVFVLTSRLPALAKALTPVLLASAFIVFTIVSRVLGGWT